MESKHVCILGIFWNIFIWKKTEVFVSWGILLRVWTEPLCSIRILKED